VPRAVDELEGVAYWNAGAGAIVARSHLPGEAMPLALAEAPTDLAVGFDGVLYVALAGGVRMHDLRGRWADVTVSSPGFTPWRLAADARGGVWALERASGRIARLTGRPLTVGPFFEYDGTTFRPDPENCHPPALTVQPEPVWPAGERALALAHHPERGLALLSWANSDGVARLRAWDERLARLDSAWELSGARYAYALAFVDAERVVVRVPGRVDAPAFDLGAADGERRVRPSGDVYPLADEALEAPFAHRVAGPPRYPVALEGGARGAEPLHRLSLTNLARHGEARSFGEGVGGGEGAGGVAGSGGSVTGSGGALGGGAGAGGATGAHRIDSGDQRTVWHRLYAEARLPARTGFIVWCAATAEPAPPPADARGAWLPHAFGDATPGEPHAPRAARERTRSELPHHPGVGVWPPEDRAAGLWSVLIQNPRRRVRRVVGRYLWIRVEMFGDGRFGPEIAALRAWASRFSYRDQYLPRLYRESRFGAPALEPGERVSELDVSHAPLLDAAGAPDTTLLASLEEAGVAATVTRVGVEAPGSAWLVRDAASGRAWHLRREELPGSGPAVGVYRPQATPADFLERMLSSFEGVLTPLEDRIASAHLLTDPASVPEDGLDWLGAWIGVAFDPALPADRRRAWLQAAPRLARWHGTRRGLELALDVASNGGVSGGEIVVIEDFRLRRLLATLLGVDLNVEDDPLLPGLIVSGNSVVGDTLFVGEAERVELLALFREEVASERENDQVLAFYERLAHRATVLVHRSVSDTDLGLLRRVVELESPAHADVRVVTATWPLLVGVASLVGVDTYLGPRRPRRPARVQLSAAGQDFVLAPAALDPRVGGAAAPPPPSEPPVADAGPDFVAPFGESFELDGSGSRAAPGRSIERWRWRRLPPD
jgi:phage tail-like protein